MMKLALIALAILCVASSSQAQCSSCLDYVSALRAVIFSEENEEYQIDFVTELYCDEGDSQCESEMQITWTLVLTVLSQVDDFTPQVCSSMEAEDNCQDWQAATSDHTVCVDRLDDFIALGNTLDFEDFLGLVSATVCRLLCGDEDECLELCIPTVEENLGLSFGALLDQLQLAAQGFCQAITSQ